MFASESGIIIVTCAGEETPRRVRFGDGRRTVGSSDESAAGARVHHAALAHVPAKRID